MTVLAPEYVIPPAGITAASTWVAVPFIDPASPPPILAPRIDATTGERTSLFVGDDPTYAAILIQFRTVFGSGVAVENDGNRFAEIRKNGDDAPALIAFEVDRIFEPFIAAGLVRLDSVAATTATRGWRADVSVKFTLLHTGRPVELATQ